MCGLPCGRNCTRYPARSRESGRIQGADACSKCFQRFRGQSLSKALLALKSIKKDSQGAYTPVLVFLLKVQPPAFANTLQSLLESTPPTDHQLFRLSLSREPVSPADISDQFSARRQIRKSPESFNRFIPTATKYLGTAILIDIDWRQPRALRKFKDALGPLATPDLRRIGG